MTAQIHEVLIYEGQAMSMAFCPMLPFGDPRLVERTAKESVGRDSMLHSTACWRQYRGTWEIRDGKLYLRGIDGRYRLAGNEPLLADWFTGVLRVPRGKLLDYVHMGFGSVYEEELHISIDMGLVRNVRVLNNQETAWDVDRLSLENLPGRENRFLGDDLR